MKREKNNIVNIVFCLLALLPILLILISLYSTGSYLGIMREISAIATSISFLSDIKNIVLVNVLKWPSGTSNVYLDFAIGYFSWLFVLFVIDLCYYGLLFFLRIIKGLIDKLGGNI